MALHSFNDKMMSSSKSELSELSPERWEKGETGLCTRIIRTFQKGIPLQDNSHLSKVNYQLPETRKHQLTPWSCLWRTNCCQCSHAWDLFALLPFKGPGQDKMPSASTCALDNSKGEAEGLKSRPLTSSLLQRWAQSYLTPKALKKTKPSKKHFSS